MTASTPPTLGMAGIVNALHILEAAAEPSAERSTPPAPVHGLRTYLLAQPEHERAFKVRDYTVTFSVHPVDRTVNVDVSNTKWDRDVLVTFTANVYNDSQPGLYKYVGGQMRRQTFTRESSLSSAAEFLKALVADAIKLADELYHEQQRKFGTTAATEPTATADVYSDLVTRLRKTPEKQITLTYGRYKIDVCLVHGRGGLLVTVSSPDWEPEFYAPFDIFGIDADYRCYSSRESRTGVVKHTGISGNLLAGAADVTAFLRAVVAAVIPAAQKARTSYTNQRKDTK